MHSENHFSVPISVSNRLIKLAHFPLLKPSYCFRTVTHPANEQSTIYTRLFTVR